MLQAALKSFREMSLHDMLDDRAAADSAPGAAQHALAHATLPLKPPACPEPDCVDVVACELQSKAQPPADARKQHAMANQAPSRRRLSRKSAPPVAQAVLDPAVRKASFQKARVGRFARKCAARARAHAVPALAPPPAAPATAVVAAEAPVVASELRQNLRKAGVPEVALPTEPPRGKKNYTIASKCQARVEVQHAQGNYFVKKASGNVPLGVGKSPHVTWNKFGGAAAAWEEALERAGVAMWEPS